MNLEKDQPLRRYKWHIIVVGLILVAVVLLTIFTDIFQTPEAGPLPQLLQLFGVLLLLGVVLIILLKVLKILATLQENDAKLEKITGSLEKSREVLTQINQNTRLSETAKAIAFRDVEIQSLREAVFDKLQQQDFNTTYEIINEIANSTIYQELAKQLRAEADKYRDATDQERENQVIGHVEKLFENYQWAKASALIERLIKAYPNSEKAKEMRQKLLDKKQKRKKVLLETWDDAVKRQATDQSLEILRELDLYLTPNEGLALQEAAREVFRTKLHNLGVQFSIAVSEKQWNRAVDIGQQIIHNFPNSKMAEEIREKMHILKQKVTPQES